MALETVVMGQVAAGDAILYNDEFRAITMRLSNGSLILLSTFSKSLKTPTKCPDRS
jgi:hypothetical protein